MPLFWSRPTALSLCIVLVLLASLISAAQSQGTNDVHVVPRKPTDTHTPEIIDPKLHTRTKPLRVDVNLVLVPVTVMDEKNHPVMGLSKNDFTLYEQEKPQQIQFFSDEDGPISVGVILDLSASMGNKIETERAAMAQFFNNANPADDYFIVTFSSRPRMVADTTQSIDEIEGNLATVTPAGYTALLDAVYLGLQKLRSARYERRALLVISDGGDNNSRYKLREIKDLLQEADVQVYGIGIFDDHFPLLNRIEEKLGKHLLTQLTDVTGGRTLEVKNIAALPDAAAQVSRELRSQYVLGYRLLRKQRKDEWRKIKIRVATPASGPSRRAYYKRGYYARPDTVAASSGADQ